MAAGDWRPCPCRARRSEQAAAARRRILSALMAAGLAALAVLCVSAVPVSARLAAPVSARLAAVPVSAGWPSAGLWARLVLIAVAVGAVGAFCGLQVVARSGRRGPPAFADWRTWPPGWDPWAGGGGGGKGDGHAVRSRLAGGRPAQGHWPGDPACLRYS
jgi:hypothetical protein